ncbi:MAG: hypothetical protein KBD47_01470 [Candidatus Pacebacteria bacterium]|nr:hypothetical protein [Candidatus Paceibacterota bacterium]
MNLPDRLDLIKRLFDEVILDEEFAEVLRTEPLREWKIPQGSHVFLNKLTATCRDNGYRVPDISSYMSGQHLFLLIAGIMHNVDPLNYGPRPAKPSGLLSPQQLLDEIETLWNQGKLLLGYDIREKTVKTFPLTDEARPLVRQAVQFCLDHGIAPSSSVSGEDGICDANITSLSAATYADLIEKIGLAIERAD